MIKKISVLLIAALIVILSSMTTVYAASDIIGPSVIHKESNQVFTINDLLGLYDIDVFIDEDGYTGHGNVPGEYVVTLIQGRLTKDVTIIVVEDWGTLEESTDVLFVTDYKDIYVANSRMLSLYEIIYFIYGSTGYVVTDYQFRYEQLVDEYHYSFVEGSIPEGSYELSFRLTYYSGEQSSYSAVIHAVEIQELPGIILEPPKSTIDTIMSIVPWVLGGIFIFYLMSHRKKKGGFSQ